MMQKVEAIVIRTNDYGESNKIVTLFTRENGKVGVMARGAKKPKSRLAAISQLFIHGLYLFQKSNGLGTLNQAEMIHSFKEIRNDLFLASYATYIVEMIDKLTEEKQPNEPLFQLLQQTLLYLDEGIDPEVLLRIFEMKMMQVAGITPELDQCAVCGSTEVPAGFSIKEAGFLCKKCMPKDEHAFKITPHTARLLRLFYYIDLSRLGQISLKDETKKELKLIISAYYDEYSGVTLRSKRFLDQLDRMGDLKPY